MRELLRTFKISREERWLALVALVVFILLNALTIYKYGDLFMQPVDDYWKLFIGRFRVSGYDPITYYVLSDWETRYNVYRHPLLAFFMYLPYLLNQGVLSLTGLNGVQLVTAMILVTASLYSFLFLNRIFREIVGLAKRDALLLSTLCFSFAYIMVATMVPDHFILSMMMLLLTLYVAGRQIKEGRQMSRSQTIWLFIFTAGISLNNGIKVFLANLFVNGKRFFHPMNLLLAVIIPAALMWGVSCWEYRTYVWPKEQARAAMKQKKTAEREQAIASMSAEQQRMVREQQEKRKQVLARQAAKSGTPMKKVGFLSWTDTSTSRIRSIYENLFGEAIQFHRQHFLGDTLVFRPVFVSYDWGVCYVIEGVIVLLFLVGLWAGRRQRFLWLVLSCFAFDMSIHLVLGFGLNEIFIMAPHWLFTIPFAIAYLFRNTCGICHFLLRATIVLLSFYLLLYNGIPLVDFLLSPIQSTI